MLGVTFVAVATVLDCAWALVAGAASARLRASTRARRWQDRVSGTTLVGLGVAAAAARR